MRNTVLVAVTFLALSCMAADDAPRGALPPHPLDNAFEAANEKKMAEALADSELFKKAV